MTRRDRDEPRVGVGVLVRRGSDVLLVLRRNVHGDGTWSTPGGHLDFGEAPEDCAVREVREETGIEIDGVRYIGVTNDVFEVEGRHYITVWMQAAYLSGSASVVAEHEIADLMWCRYDSLPSNLFLSLRHLVEGRGYGVDLGGEGWPRSVQEPA
jgi:8-oxo-dGTP diphosphatase